MLQVLRILSRGIRWRLGSSLLTVLTAAMAVGAALFGPLYLHAANDSLVRHTLAQAPAQTRGVTLAPSGGAQTADLADAAKRVRRLGDYGPPISTALSGIGLTLDRSPLGAQLLARSGICHRLRFSAGRCPSGLDQVALSVRSARELGLGVGSTVRPTVHGGGSLRLRVVGVYEVPSLADPAWWGAGEGFFSYGTTSGPQKVPQLDSFITTRQTALDVPQQDVPSLSLQLPLRVRKVGAAQASMLQTALQRVRIALIDRRVQLNSGLRGLLAGVDQQQAEMRTIVLAAAAQLMLVAVWILAALLTRSAASRRSELRVAQLRGFAAGRLVAVAIAEPLILCLVGSVIGLISALVGVTAARDDLMDPAAEVGLSGLTWLALAVSLAAILGTLLAGAVRLLRSSELGSVTSGGRGRRASVEGAIGDALLVTLGIIALLALSESNTIRSGSINPLVSVSPGLLALGVGVLGSRGVRGICRVVISRGAAGPHVARYLAVRQVLRRPAVVRQGRLLIVILCFTAFSIVAWSVARTNRGRLVDFGVGAPTVVRVAPGATSVLSAVSRVDPQGHYAMAAIQIQTPSSELLAVQSSRLATVVDWPPGLSRRPLAALARELTPAGGHEVMLSAGDLRFKVRAAFSGRQAAGQEIGRAELAAWVFNPTAGTTIVGLGPLRAGSGVYGASLAVPCPGGCRLVGLGVIPIPGVLPPHSGTFTVALGATTAGRLPASSFTASANGVALDASSGELTLTVPADVVAGYAGATGASNPPMVTLSDHPSEVPGIVSATLQSTSNSVGSNTPVPAQGLDGSTLNVAPTAVVAAVPRLGANGIVVDLGLLQRFQSEPTLPTVDPQVWLGAGAPGDAVARLRAAGLQVISVDRASTDLHRARETGPALADDFLIIAAIVGLVVAVVALVGELIGLRRRRATETFLLELSGVPRRFATRAMWLEGTVLAVIAALGPAAGVLAAVLALPSLPEQIGAPPIPLSYRLPGAALAAILLAGVIVIGLVTWIGAATSTRLIGPSLLRDLEDDGDL